MAEARPVAATRSLSAESVARLRAHLGDLNTATLQRLDGTLEWYRHLTPDERSALGLVAQRGLEGFVRWFERPHAGSGHVLTDVFGQAPTELTRSINLQRALQLIRTVVDVVESTVPDIVLDQDQVAVRESVLRYSREVAFTLADVYARAAETRGAWDSRLEAVLLSAVLRGNDSDEIQHRATAIGWQGGPGVLVMAGAVPGKDKPAFIPGLRRAASKHACDVLIGVQSDRLVLVLGSVTDAAAVAEALTPWFGEGPVIVGPVVESLTEAHVSARHALAALSAAPAHPRAPRPTDTSELLPERALMGDPTAREALLTDVYEPLLAAGPTLLETVDTYSALGHSLEATARALFIHTNTVRYRLRRVSELTGWDPLVARDVYVLHTAITLGRLSARWRDESAPEGAEER
ncbi:MAG: helix-turn-helix domain-containing protein [Micrococcus sp.]|nr:helix-turn-helix domain-containing protein [Micrococcus sp.]